jgi:DNA-directed RNA polymerase subunit M/transcription elongation factor TFIIS
MSEDSVQSDPPVLNENISPPNDQTRTTRIRVFRTSWEANLAATKLQSEGLLAQLGGEARQAGIGIYGAVSDGIDLYVPAEQVPAATKILDAIETENAKLAVAQKRCPKCGSEKTAGYNPSRRRNAAFVTVCGILLTLIPGWLHLSNYEIDNWGTVGIVAFILGIFLLIRSTWQSYCRSCGNVWKPDPEEADGDDAG